jgi:hypothetical protein
LRQLGLRSLEARALDVTGRAYRLLGRSDDAVAFHRQAIAIHQDLDDRWWLAVAEQNLAAALDEG